VAIEETTEETVANMTREMSEHSATARKVNNLNRLINEDSEVNPPGLPFYFTLANGRKCNLLHRDNEVVDLCNLINQSFVFSTGPIVIHGDRGIGRTALLEAIVNIQRSISPDPTKVIFFDNTNNLSTLKDRSASVAALEKEVVELVEGAKKGTTKRVKDKAIVIIDDFDKHLIPPQSYEGNYVSGFMRLFDCFKQIVLIVCVPNHKMHQMKRHVYADDFVYYPVQPFKEDQIRDIIIDRLKARGVKRADIYKYVEIILKHRYYLQEDSLRRYLMVANSFVLKLAGESKEVFEGRFYESEVVAEDSATQESFIRAMALNSRFTEDEIGSGIKLKFTSADIIDNVRSQVVLSHRNEREIVNVIIKKHLGLSEQNKPVAVVLAVGQTGSGKTETAKALARVCYGSEDRIIRIDLNQFKNSHHINRLFGSAPGYVGYNEGTFLTRELQSKYPCVILFDEIEKAHDDILDGIMNLLDEGSFTESSGRTHDISKCIMFMTSNAAAEEIGKKGMGKVGFMDEADRKDEEEGKVSIAAVKELLVSNGMRPEFVNRVDNVLVFKSLDEAMLKQVADVRLKKTMKEIFRTVEVEFPDRDKILDYIVSKVNKNENGRSVNRIIKNVIVPSIIDRFALTENKKIEFTSDQINTDYEP